MRRFEDYKKECMKDPEFKKGYEELKPEMAVVRAILDARSISHLTQKELAEKQASIKLISARSKTVQEIHRSDFFNV